MCAKRRSAQRGRPRQPVPRELPDDLYDYDDDPAPRISPPRGSPSHVFDVEKLPVIDDWPEEVPITEAEIRVEKLLGSVLGRRSDQAERRRQHIAELQRRAAESDLRLKRLYDAIEVGIADLNDPALAERIAGLKVIRDQAKADADRAQALLDSPGHSSISPAMIRGFSQSARERIRGRESGYRRDHLRAFGTKNGAAHGRDTPKSRPLPCR